MAFKQFSLDTSEPVLMISPMAMILAAKIIRRCLWDSGQAHWHLISSIPGQEYPGLLSLLQVTSAPFVVSSMSSAAFGAGPGKSHDFAWLTWSKIL